MAFHSHALNPSLFHPPTGLQRFAPANTIAVRRAHVHKFHILSQPVQLAIVHSNSLRCSSSRLRVYASRALRRRHRVTFVPPVPVEFCRARRRRLTTCVTSSSSRADLPLYLWLYISATWVGPAFSICLSHISAQQGWLLGPLEFLGILQSQ